MKEFVVSFMNLENNLMDIQKVVAEDAAAAMRKYIDRNCYGLIDIDFLPDEAEDIRRYVADCDCAISYMET
jgi:hypothetical protein